MGQLSTKLGLQGPSILRYNPDRKNIFLRIVKKGNDDVVTEYEKIFMPECDNLFSQRESFPVTLMYMPMEWCAEAQNYCMFLFGGQRNINIDNCLFATYFSTTQEAVLLTIRAELKKENPRIRLVFCTPAVGMGFHAPAVCRIIHARPPMSIIDFVQQIGRAGRGGQESESVVHYNSRDIAANTPMDQHMREYCREKGCLRRRMLEPFGFEPEEENSRCCMNCTC